MRPDAAITPLPRRRSQTRRWGRARFAALLLTAALLAGGAGHAQVGLYGPSDPTEIAYGTTATLVFTLTNDTPTTFNGTPHVRLPPGWQAVLPPQAVRVPPGGRAAIIEPIHVPPHTAARDYQVILTIAQPARSASATVTVPTQRKVTATLAHDVPQTAQAHYALRFIITNRGNVPESLALSATTSAGSTVTLDRSDARLALGASTTVTATVTPPNHLARSTQESVHLLVRASKGGKPLTAATATTELLATRQPATLAYHAIPFRVTLGTLLDNTLPTHPAGALANTHLTIDGSGTLREGGDTTLAVHLDNALDGSWHHDHVTLATPTFAVAVGDLALDGLNVLPKDAGLGVHLHVTPTRDTSIDTGLVYASDGALHARATYRLQPVPGLSVATTAALQGDTPAVAVAARSQATLSGVALDTRVSAAVTRTADGAPTSKLATNLTAAGPHGRLHVTADASGRDFLTISPASFNVHISAAQTQPQHDGRLLSLQGRFAYAVTYPAALFTGAPLTSKTHFAVHASGDLGDTPLAAAFSHLSFTDRADPSTDVTFSRASLATVLPLDHDTRLYPELAVTWGRRLTAHNTPISAPTLTAAMHARFPLLNGALSPDASATIDLTTGTLADGLAHLTWTGTIASHATAGASLQYQLDHRALNANAFLRLGPTSGTRWRFNASLTTSTSAPLQATLAASVSVPVRIPVSRRPNISAVRGRLLDASGHGVPNQLVFLAGYTAKTNAQGAYRFSAIPQGHHELALQTALPVGMGTLPQLPLPIDIEQPTTTLPDVRLVKLATLTGHVHLSTPQQDLNALYGSTDGTTPALAGIPFELRNGSDTIYAEALPDGTFTQMLPPGRWTISAVAGTMPPHWKITPSATTFTLAPGQAITAHFTLEAAKRTIRFTNGGTLGLNVSPPAPSTASDAR